ncbi:MAG: sigma-70 family RNA polymerase sigma factor [Chloroflexi bacterium]|nr:sigma-70 family RNA polymerase sigma factor [Chloroflexota bacterium]
MLDDTRPDEELASLIAQKDTHALRLLYERYARPVYSLALRMTDSTSAAEEITQEVFLKLWRRASSYRFERGRFGTWLLAIAHHEAVDHLRRSRGQSQTVPLDVFLEGEHRGLSGSDHGGSEEWERVAVRHDVNQALDKLPDPLKQIVVLAYYEGLTQAEIAQRTATPLGTVKTRMRSALQKLKESLLSTRREG